MVDLVVLACVLTSTTKKGRQLFFLPQIFSSRTAPGGDVKLNLIFYRACLPLSGFENVFENVLIVRFYELH